MSVVEITRKVEFDAAHRLESHTSKCRNVHGHRYVLEVTLRGEPTAEQGNPADGMVFDFGDVKSILNEHLVDEWDHALIVCEHDELMCRVLDMLPDDHRSVVIPLPPTVENMARVAFIRLAPALTTSAMKLQRLRLYETPNCWADVTAEMMQQKGA